MPQWSRPPHLTPIDHLFWVVVERLTAAVPIKGLQCRECAHLFVWRSGWTDPKFCPNCGRKNPDHKGD